MALLIVVFSNIFVIKKELETQFELLYDEKKKVNQRREYDLDSLYPIKELAIPINHEIESHSNTLSSSASVFFTYLIKHRKSL